MSKTSGRRRGAALLSAAVVGTVLAGAASPASAATTGPERPTHLFNGVAACSTDPNAPDYVAYGGLGAGSYVDIEGVPQDTDTADNPSLTAQYALWPTSDPAQTTTYSHTDVSTGFEGPADVLVSSLVEGQTYAWQARTVAGSAVSPWTHTCYFVLDQTNPAAVPTVTSANYPTGQWDQGGAPLQFTFGANGVSDVAGYAFSWTQPVPVPNLGGIGAYGIPQPQNPWADTAHFVQASSLGGTATVNLLPTVAPDGPVTLYVESLDRAFNVSATISYQVFISSTAPTITAPATTPAFDTPAKFTFTPNPTAEAASPIVSYSVTVGGGAARKVKAGADGSATVSLRLNQPGGNNDVTVTSTSADGWVSDSAFQSYYFDTTPVVNSTDYPEYDTSGGAGIAGTFTFTAQVPNIVSYTYSFDGGTTETTVAADASGDAQISWTPPGTDFYDLNVYGTTKDGITLEYTDYFFGVN